MEQPWLCEEGVSLELELTLAHPIIQGQDEFTKRYIVLLLSLSI
jgi:hypothetical protein